MANENVFNNKAAAYVSARPSYAPEAIDQIIKPMLSYDRFAADVGSGTGIFSSELLQRGFEVYAVEPNADMRQKAEQKFCAEPRFHSIVGTAEATTLPDGCVSLVTAASAFHWFDPVAFRKECRRILKPNGSVCIFHHSRVYDAFTQAQHELFLRFCPEYSSLTHGVDKSLSRSEGFFESYQVARFAFPLHYTKEQFLQRAVSSSYVPNDCEDLLNELRLLMDKFYEGDRIEVANDTVVIWGRV